MKEQCVGVLFHGALRAGRESSGYLLAPQCEQNLRLRGQALPGFSPHGDGFVPTGKPAQHRVVSWRFQTQDFFFGRMLKTQ